MRKTKPTPLNDLGLRRFDVAAFAAIGFDTSGFELWKGLAVQILQRAFPHLTEDQRLVIADIGVNRTFEHGDIIIRQAQVPGSLFVVVSGNARVMQRRTDTINVEFTGPLGPGDLFGEISFIDGHPASATIVADGDVDVVALPESDVRPLLKGDPELAANFYHSLLAVIAHRLRATNMHIVTPEDFE